MADYMTQKMSSGTLTAITYYRKQSKPHVDHKESGKFTADAKANYATKNSIAQSAVDAGTYKSCQGVPTGGTTENI